MKTLLCTSFSPFHSQDRDVREGGLFEGSYPLNQIKEGENRFFLRLMKKKFFCFIILGGVKIPLCLSMGT